MDDHMRFSGTKYEKGNNNKQGSHSNDVYPQGRNLIPVGTIFFPRKYISRSFCLYLFNKVLRRRDSFTPSQPIGSSLLLLKAYALNWHVSTEKSYVVEGDLFVVPAKRRRSPRTATLPHWAKRLTPVPSRPPPHTQLCVCL